MRQYLNIGPVSIRLHSKHLAPWGFPRLQIGGYSFWSWDNDGNFSPAGYHPRSSITWIWSTKIVRTPCRFVSMKGLGGPTYQKVWLPFGWRLIVMRQKPMWKEVAT